MNDMSEGATSCMYKKVCAGLLDTYVHADPDNPKQWIFEPPGKRLECSHVWIQARCVEVVHASPKHKHTTATLEDGTGTVLALCGDQDPLFSPGKYLMILGRLMKSAVMNNAWVIRPYKTVGLLSFH